MQLFGYALTEKLSGFLFESIERRLERCPFDALSGEVVLIEQIGRFSTLVGQTWFPHFDESVCQTKPILIVWKCHDDFMAAALKLTLVSWKGKGAENAGVDQRSPLYLCQAAPDRPQQSLKTQTDAGAERRLVATL